MTPATVLLDELPSVSSLRVGDPVHCFELGNNVKSDSVVSGPLELYDQTVCCKRAPSSIYWNQTYLEQS